MKKLINFFSTQFKQQISNFSEKYPFLKILFNPEKHEKKVLEDTETKKLKAAMNLILDAVESEKDYVIISEFIENISNIHKRRKLSAFTSNETDDFCKDYEYIDENGKLKFKEFEKKVLSLNKPKFEYTEWAINFIEILKQRKSHIDIVKDIKERGFITQ